jgi:hypothetical protein
MEVGGGGEGGGGGGPWGPPPGIYCYSEWILRSERPPASKQDNCKRGTVSLNSFLEAI